MQINKSNNEKARAALLSAGLSDPVLSFALAQAEYESNGFDSNLFASVNNGSGIKFVGQSFATDSGIVAKDGGTFAAYDSLDLWAQDFIRVISLQLPGNDIGAPIDAKNLADYVHRLELNNYFGAASESSYLSGLKKYLDSAPVVADNALNIASYAKQLNKPDLIIGSIVFVILILLTYLIFKRNGKK